MWALAPSAARRLTEPFRCAWEIRREASPGADEPPRRAHICCRDSSGLLEAPRTGLRLDPLRPTTVSAFAAREEVLANLRRVRVLLNWPSLSCLPGRRP